MFLWYLGQLNSKQDGDHVDILLMSSFLNQRGAVSKEKPIVKFARIKLWIQTII